MVKVGVKVRGQDHDWWSQCLGSRSGSMSGVKVRGVVKVMGRGSVSGGLWSDGWWGRLEINNLFLSRTHDRIEFHSNPTQSIPFHSIPFHSMIYPMPGEKWYLISRHTKFINYNISYPQAV